MTYRSIASLSFVKKVFIVLALAVVMAVPPAIVTPATTQAASCSVIKSSTWGRGWACYSWNTADTARIEVYGELSDYGAGDNMCVGFLMYDPWRAANGIAPVTSNIHKGLSCNSTLKSFSYAINKGDTPTEGCYAYAAVARWNSAGSLQGYKEIDATAPTAPDGGC